MGTGRMPDKATARFARTLARFNRKVANPVIRPLAGWLPPLGVIRHRGRVTGNEYANPVLAFRTQDGIVIGVLYGTDSDWVRNVLATGQAEVKRLGATREYQQPRFVGGEGSRLVPAPVRVAFRLLRVRNFVALTNTPHRELGSR
jgi:deazaflavin-dependent oxidoreductase (nitroreductase family)